jgi:hypothetical protein
MSVRQWLNDNQTVALTAVGGTFLLCIFILMLQFSGGEEGVGETYTLFVWDDELGTFRVEENDSPLPQAVVFACGDCSDRDAQFAAYLINDDGDVRPVDSDPDAWVIGISDEAKSLKRQPMEHCSEQGEKAVRCFPK